MNKNSRKSHLNVFDSPDVETDLSLITKLLTSDISSNKSDLDLSLDKVYEHFENKFIPTLRASSYRKSNTTIKKIRAELQQLEFYNELPEILGKKIVGLINFNDNETKLCLKDIFGDKTTELIYSCRNLPVLIFPNNSKVSVINDVNKEVEVSNREFFKINNRLWKYDIEIGAFLKVAIISCDIKFNNIVFVYFPPYSALGKNVLTKEIISRLDIKLIISNGEELSKEYIRGVQLFTAKKDHCQVLSIHSNSTTPSNPKLKSTQEAMHFLIDNDISVYNDIFAKRMAFILSDVKLYYKELLAKFEDDFKLANVDLTKISDTTLINEIQKLYSDKSKEKSLAEQDVKNIQIATESFMDICNRYESFLSNNLNISEKKNLVFSESYLSIIEALFLRYLDLNAFTEEIKLLNVINSSKSNRAYIFELLINQQKKASLNDLFIKKLKDSNEQDEFTVRAKIRLHNYIGYTISDLVDANIHLSSYDDIVNLDELFYFGSSLIKQEYNIAIELLRKAARLGDKESTKLLLKFAQKDEKLLCSLGHEMIPEANYERAIHLQNEKKYNLANVFLKLAASQGHIEAIEHLLNTKVNALLKKQIPRPISIIVNMQKGAESSRTKEALDYIKIYNFLISKTNNPSYYWQLGRLYKYIGDYNRAYDSFLFRDDGDSHLQIALMYMYHDAPLGQDLEKAKEHLIQAINKGKNSAKEKLIKVESWIRDNRQKKELKKRSYSQQVSNSSVSVSKADDSWCFITTAVCSSLGKPDNCDELATLRAFRDYQQKNSLEMEMLIEEYYRIAPQIVKKINSCADRDRIYILLWTFYISKIYRLIKELKFNEATLLYIKMVRELSSKYAVPMDRKVYLNILELISFK